MYIGIQRICFDPDSGSIHPKDAKNLCLKIKQRFSVLASFETRLETGEIHDLFITTQTQKGAHMKTLSDQICDFIESTGFGRISQQEVFTRDMHTFFADTL